MNVQKHIEIFDSTLRDGAQGEGITFSVVDKLDIVRALDAFGVDYIEAGNPGSNQKDLAFFAEAGKLSLRHAKLVAFGSTRRKGISADEDANCRSLLSAGTGCVAVFGKSWDLHVSEILRAEPGENLEMIEDTVAFFKKHGKEVFFDAEHFFDGYKGNPAYAVSVLDAAVRGGADCLVLCDTNGGAFPDEIAEVTRAVCARFAGMRVGIHCHNDGGCAVSNSVTAVRSGACHVQGTFAGFGERCGNAPLCSVIPNLQLKLGYDCVPADSIATLTETARLICEISNVAMDANAPFVGVNAFAHKGGMHIDGVSKISHSFEHIPPDSVGNSRRFLMSEVSGRGAILPLVRKYAPNADKNSKEATELADTLKRLEFEGYQYESAEASFELVVMEYLGRGRRFFELINFRIICEQDNVSSAIIKIKVGEREEIAAADGDGPVNALDNALRRALEVFYPDLKKVRLIDYKVRVLDSKDATAAKVRVLIQSSDGADIWATVGVSTNIIGASWKALADSFEYKLYKMDSVKKEV